MSRYITRDYKIHNTIIKDCPIKIDKTRILFDTETNLIILQLSITNLSNKDIKKIIFNTNTYNIEKNLINESIKIKIEEKITKNSNYSIKETIIYNDKNIHYIDLEIKEIIYDNNEYWKKTKTNKLETIEKANIIPSYSDTYKVLTNYNIKLKNYPEFNNNYWRCSCSNINLYSSEKCSSCNTRKKELEDIFDINNIEELIKEYQKEKEEKHKKLINDIRNKISNILKVVIPVLIILLIFHLINIFPYQRAYYFYKKENYNKAIDILKNKNTDKAYKILSDIYYDYGNYLLENNNYTEAINYFQKTDYHNKNELINKTKYQQANDYLNNKEYNKALNKYKEIAILYKDVSDKIKETNYLISMDYINDKDYSNALKYLKEIIGYKDVNDNLKTIYDELEDKSIITKEIPNIDNIIKKEESGVSDGTSYYGIIWFNESGNQITSTYKYDDETLKYNTR